MTRSIVTRLILTSLLLYSATAVYGESFECKDPRKGNSSLVIVVAAVNDDRETGTIEVANVKYETMYMVNGFDRFWVWGELDGNPEFLFRIQPDGSGHYFELPNDLIPKQEFTCRER